MPSPNPEFIGRYEILAEIGRGSMGIVYKARDPNIDRVVAVKTISLFDVEPADEREYRERFYQEARTAGRLSHPGIVTIFDVGTDATSNAPYIVMEYIAGRSLNKLLAAASEGRLQLGPALQLVQEVAEALHYAHDEGVIHRDIKPANILLTPLGQAKLADFGIARLDQAHLTLAGRVMGSPAYMAPEQLRGDAIDSRSDLFSLGVVLYTLLTGHRPFQGNSTATVCFKLANQVALRASAWNADLPPEIDHLLERAMAKDPTQRFQSGMQMAQELQKCRSGLELSPEDTFVGLRHLIERPGVASQHSDEDSRQSLHPNGQASPLASASASSTTVTIPRPLAAVGGLVLMIALAICGVLLWSRREHPISILPLSAQTEREPQGPLTYKADSQAKASKPAETVRPSESPTHENNLVPFGQKQSPRRIAPVRSKSTAPPILVRTLEPASLVIVIEHGFEEGIASVVVDNQPAYNESLRGISKRRGLLFHKTQGSQRGNITLAPGKHDIRIHVQSVRDDYDASTVLSRGFSAGSKATLLVKCDKRRNKLVLGIN